MIKLKCIQYKIGLFYRTVKNFAPYSQYTFPQSIIKGAFRAKTYRKKKATRNEPP